MGFKKMTSRASALFIALALIGSAVQADAETSGARAFAAVARRPQEPPPPPKPLAGLIGQYGAGGDFLDIYEDGGRLVAKQGEAAFLPLSKVSRAVYAAPGDSRSFAFDLGPTGAATGVKVGGVRLARRDFGVEAQAAIRAMVHADAGERRQAALRASPPAEPARPRPSNLVSLSRIDPAIKLDIRYATGDNFMGFPLYERAAAFMQRPAAMALARVDKAVRAKGYGLLVFDAYRPWFVTKMFWDAVPAEGKVFVADPAQGSRHNRGCAVDLTLYDLGTGKPVEMTGRYDEMSKRSYADYAGGTSRQRWLRDLLRREMEAQGFRVYPEEWWHFDYKDWANYPIGNRTFDQVEGEISAR